MRSPPAARKRRKPRAADASARAALSSPDVDAPSLTSRRLELVPLTPKVLEALLAGRRDDAAALLGAKIQAGWPAAADKALLARRLDQMRSEPASARWLVRALVLRADGPASMVGHAGFHGPPGVNGLEDPAALELGYTVFAEHRGRGYATEAAGRLIEWAQAEGVRRFIASVAPANEPSLTIVRKLGFVQTGEQWDDEDGLELVFELHGDEVPPTRAR